MSAEIIEFRKNKNAGQTTKESGRALNEARVFLKKFDEGTLPYLESIIKKLEDLGIDGKNTKGDNLAGDVKKILRELNCINAYIVDFFYFWTLMKRQFPKCLPA